MKDTYLSLASENYAGVHPDILNAIIQCNSGHQRSYGNDNYTAKARAVMKAQFGEDAEIHFVLNGTGANVFALSTMTRSYNAIICSDMAHVFVSESTAVEAFTGCRLLLVKTKDGKIIPQELEQAITRIGDIHFPQAKVLTITQPTEYGTVYTLEEMKELVAIARKSNLYVHIDGARLFNAAVALDCSLKEAVASADAVSLGGTKAGMMIGEAVIFLNKDLYNESGYLLKRSMQLASKMRFISCQFEAMLSNDLWKKIATHTNAMAKLLAKGLQQFEEVQITQPVDTNAVFAILPKPWYDALQSVMPFYIWDEAINEARLICSFDIQEEDINRFIEAIRGLKKEGR
ncbi:low specificity L-threonine aldolase [Ilyomonas limi]|uniref:Low specificity L-threonine aldolase n=1 Tax=Ilyomonas limi TaxID=2575867 RepID=A0A4U3L6S1_9BACT|nr:low specificity L-threonine aldolase [Ilyomonas limi]TKK70948.1 low specificity L-threonine aldolase [Ilyomonas limi]